MITTDTGAKKWENSDNWRQIYQAHNDSVDAEDAAIAALQDAIAIVANGNTHAAIAAGQFVFVKNHDTLAAGLYTANSAIAANATLTSSNLTADPNGGLNALNSKLEQDTGDQSMDNGNVHYRRKGNVVVVNIANAGADSSTVFGTLPSGYRPLYAIRQLSYDGKLHLYIGTDGSVFAQAGSATSGYFVGQNITYLTNDAFPSG